MALEDGGRQGRIRRGATGIGVLVAAVLLAAACGKSSNSAAGTTTSQATTTTVASTTTSAASGSSTSATSPAGSTTTAVQPTLGRAFGVFAHGRGFGEVKPATIDNGGDPTGLVQHVTWSAWGSPTATGAGTSTYVAPNESVAQGTQQAVTVKAFNLGTCGGKLMYRAVEWYFPQHGEAFDSAHYQDICNGAYVGS